MVAKEIAAALALFGALSASILSASIQAGPQGAPSPAAPLVETERVGDVDWLTNVSQAEQRSRALGRPMLLLVRCPP